MVHPTGRLTDPSGDQGLEGPAHADLLAVAVEDGGDVARFSVDVAAALPSTPPEGEVIGVGVDLYRANTLESDYQLFADGSSEGWFAYLTTPGGLVRYPGRFALGGSRLIFEIPWTSLGKEPLVRFSAFLDWSRERPVINAAAGDRAPKDGTAALSE